MSNGSSKRLHAAVRLAIFACFLHSFAIAQTATAVVTPPPTEASATSALTTVSPNTGQQGKSSLSVALTGQSTHWVQGTTTASFGSGITVNSLTVNSATTATAVISISATATAGANTVTLTTGAEVETSTGAFTVTAGAVNSVTYTYDSQGRVVKVAYETTTGTVTVTYTYDAAGNRTSVVTQ